MTSFLVSVAIGGILGSLFAYFIIVPWLDKHDWFGY